MWLLEPDHISHTQSMVAKKAHTSASDIRMWLLEPDHISHTQSMVAKKAHTSASDIRIRGYWNQTTFPIHKVWWLRRLTHQPVIYVYVVIGTRPHFPYTKYGG